MRVPLDGWGQADEGLPTPPPRRGAARTPGDADALFTHAVSALELLHLLADRFQSALLRSEVAARLRSWAADQSLPG